MSHNQSSRKKRRHDPRASSSSAAAQEQPRLSDSRAAREKKRGLQQLSFGNSQYLDWDMLDSYGDIRGRLAGMIQDPAWLRLFNIQEPAYQNLTIEVLSTMGREGDGEESKLFFQAYGDRHEIVIKTIGTVMGLYDSLEEHRHLPNDWPKEDDPEDAEGFWRKITPPYAEPFVASKVLATSFRLMEYKLLHHILAHTLCCKKTSHSKVTSFDMFYLYSIIHPYRIDLGVEVASYMFRQVDDPRTRFLSCGGYVTKLLKGMGIFVEPEDDTVVESKRISSAPFRGWGLVRVQRAAPPQQQEEVGFQDIFPGDIPIEFPSVPPPSTSASVPSSSGYDMDQLHSDIQKLQKDNEDLRKRLEAQEKAASLREKKSKKTIHRLFDALKSAICCINPEAGQAMELESSGDAEEDSSRTASF